MISIIIHVVVALASIVAATFAVVRPSKQLLALNYGLVALTVVTGSFLLLRFPAHLAPACEAGLAYLVVAASLIVIANIRLRQLSR